ncbi:MAG: cytochrome P450 [Hyphomicrobiaceae bacterium]
MRLNNLEDGPTAYWDNNGLREYPDEVAAEIAANFDLRSLPKYFYQDPYPTYHALRRHAPVRSMPDGTYFISRHADLEVIYKDTATFSSDKRIEFLPKFGDGRLYAHHTTSLVFNDPPLHTRVRKILAGALTPRAIANMRAPVESLVGQLLDNLERKSNPDLIDDFAAAIPVEVIGNMLDVPRTERGPLRGWSLAILSALEPATSEAQLQQGELAVQHFLAYLEKLVSQRRRRPGDPETDVLTRLLLGEADGSRLTENELLHNVIFILNAGHETTTNLIGNGLAALTHWPQEREKLLAFPELINNAVEEFLRFESSNQLGNRITKRAIQIGDVRLGPSTPITVCIGGANRDPTRFDQPDQLDIARSPNRHLAFASGPHQCIGMNLARLEARIAISLFLARFPQYRISEPVVRGGRARFRGFLSLPTILE